MSIRPLDCTALKYGLALAVSSLTSLHGCAALKHGSALAVGSLVCLYDCAELWLRLSLSYRFQYVRTAKDTAKPLASPIDSLDFTCAKAWQILAKLILSVHLVRSSKTRSSLNHHTCSTLRDQIANTNFDHDTLQHCGIQSISDSLYGQSMYDSLYGLLHRHNILQELGHRSTNLDHTSYLHRTSSCTYQRLRPYQLPTPNHLAEDTIQLSRTLHTPF